MYDYNNGRFLSVDPFIQSPTSTQSMNPYTYIFNNPLSGVDPSGYASRGFGSQTVKSVCIDGNCLGSPFLTKEEVAAGKKEKNNGIQYSSGGSGDDKPPSEKGNQKLLLKKPISEKELLQDVKEFVKNLRSIEKENQVSSDKQAKESRKKTNAIKPQSTKDVETTLEQRKFVIKITDRIFEALERANSSRKIDVELFLSVGNNEGGGFVITNAGLLGPQGGAFYSLSSDVIVYHIHHIGLGREPSIGDHNPVVTGDRPNVTVTYNKKGECCAIYEVGRNGTRYKFRSIKKNGKTGPWREKKGWNE